MKLPFHNVQVCGDVLFAARGGNIHSFKLSDGSHISCWRYPAEKKDAKSGVPKSSASDKLVIALSEESTPAPSQDEQGPPTKRVRLDAPASAVEEAENGVKLGNGDAALKETEEGAAVQSAEGNGNGTPKDQKKSKKPGPRPGPRSPPSERTMVLILTATSDGRHLVAVTQCKSIWLFEHDGQGQLKQLSRRVMPKRPSSLVLTPDNQNILSADKFGDVYSIPLIPSDEPPVDQLTDASPPTPAPVPAAASPSPAPEKAAYKPQASELTVHTKRNRQALLDQQLSSQNPGRHRGGTQRAEAPTFERSLLLGHVSLLTAVCLGRDAGGRPYVITADRDEHIRVSRGGREQAHVIETFCLGHEDFVNRLCVPDDGPRGFGGFLVSGGGDAELFVWRWREGELLARAPLLKLAQEIAPETSKLAVSGLWCWSGRSAEGEEMSATILAISERVPAIFVFTLGATGSLEHSRTIGLPGNPLEVEVVDGETLLVAVEPNAREAGEYDMKKSLLKVGHVNGEYQVSDGLVKDIPDLGDDETDVAEDEMHVLLYSAENLRKMDHEEGGADVE